MCQPAARSSQPPPSSAISPDDHPLADPDLLKMPKSAPHSRTVDLLALATTHLLGTEVWVFRDLNWYPTDGGNAVAPDVMVLPRPALDAPPKSYRQDESGGPAPLAAVEVVSDTDSFAALRAKARRYQRLGAVAYVVILDDEHGVLRLGPDDGELVSWIGAPLAELGGFRLEFVDGDLELTMPDGTTARTGSDLIAAAADKAEREAQALRDQLRSLGVEPTNPT